MLKPGYCADCAWKFIASSFDCPYCGRQYSKDLESYRKRGVCTDCYNRYFNRPVAPEKKITDSDYFQCSECGREFFKTTESVRYPGMCQDCSVIKYREEREGKSKKYGDDFDMHGGIF